VRCLSGADLFGYPQVINTFVNIIHFFTPFLFFSNWQNTNTTK
jgi:hypothetical protein